ncbi:hypothetical protein [Sulfurimonas paralvinellae]|uniref:Periplasmic protein n=1 Tax=Sulfurimonas paralvinellae TaxID=317658 RepID=A0A7M1B8Z3_9BACT|nr:hypothetical protein [Sulfurimonas paralvinellae]QOP46199.1 hypothetical protein FM071_07790 [Sulfurimonas paralvinellae]
MIKVLFLTLFLITSLFAQKVLYVSYDTVPKRVIKGEIFTATLKTLSTLKDFNDVEYTFSDHPGLKILDETPIREERGKFFYDTFHMQVTGSHARLPDIEASIVASDEYNATKVPGEELNVITLNPKKNFSNIIANDLQLQEYKTTSYDNHHNIVVFVATAKNCDIKAMHFNNVYKQGMESVTESYDDSKITYFVVIDKRLEYFTFSYFNLLKNNYDQISIPIIVDDDSVTTQSDLKPRDQSHDTIKMYIALAISILGFIIILFKQKYIYLILIIIPLGYTLYLSIPAKEVCIKKGSSIYLLPVENGTVFETTPKEYHLTKEGSVENFTKVKLQNQKIGWVKNEDTCSH